MDSAPFSNTIFYIVAHADDWQLFMNPETCSDLISPENKVVFIITTAGDAGKGEVYWRAREAGMKASIVYYLSPRQPIHCSEGISNINGQPISILTINQTISYFLRLPDGGVTGEGFKENEYQNLQKLENGQISSLSALDGSCTLPSWEAFRDLLRNILLIESGNSAGKRWIKFLDPDAQHNPLDHADHQSTGRALLTLKNLQGFRKVFFKGYGNACTKELSSEEIFWKAGMFAAYEKAVFDKTGYSTLAENIQLYQKWITHKPEFYREDG